MPPLLIFGGIATVCIFSEWGVTGKLFGFLLAYNWSSLVRVGRRWLRWEVRAAESTSRLDLQNSVAGSFSNLIWRRWSLIPRDSLKTRWHDAQ
jgi:hypothetical protein